MKIKKTCFSTMLSDLYGRDNYQSHIELGREYWWNWPEDSEIYRKTNKSWHKLKITYIRSGCMFYILTDAPEISEMFCSINCFLASSLILADIDPIKDLKDSLGNIESAKIKYCFNDERTIVNNWPNEKEIEIDEDKLIEKFNDSIEYINIKLLEQKSEA